MRRTILFIATIAFLLSACKTYYIPLDSFKQQFAAFDTADLREVITQDPLGGKTHYRTYPIDIIKCTDKKGEPKELINGPSIEIRFTDINDKRTVFFFDLMRVNDTVVRGSESRIFPGIQKTIPFNHIKKIEVQDGGKKFRYVSK